MAKPANTLMNKGLSTARLSVDTEGLAFAVN
jgi:hypothetical protein